MSEEIKNADQPQEPELSEKDLEQVAGGGAQVSTSDKQKVANKMNPLGGS